MRRVLLRTEFAPEKPGQPIIIAAWHPTKAAHEMKLDGLKLLRAERMPLSKDAAEAVVVKSTDGRLTFTGGEKPVFLWLTK